VRNLIVDACVKLFVRLECRDYCRFDWRIDADGFPKLLEVNPNPGWCWDGHLTKMAHLANMSYTELLEAILHAAETRLLSIESGEPERRPLTKTALTQRMS
jgi:D-alanine-D-alanine ligase